MMPKLITKSFQQAQDYTTIWHKMRQAIDSRKDNCPDQLWLLEHNPVYTLGQAGASEHILDNRGIEVVRSDRGGQVTYHGPGQLMVYCMLDIKRLGIGIKSLVCKLEQAVIEMLNELQISAQRHSGRPGVYIEAKKVCSIGLRLRRGYSYHGMAINIATDKTAFASINPCGYSDLAVTNIKDYAPSASFTSIKSMIVAQLQQQFDLVIN